METLKQHTFGTPVVIVIIQTEKIISLKWFNRRIRMDAAEGANGNLPEIELIIKASTIDGKRKGACLFCHEYFMDLYLLAELKTISLKITTVDMLKPPPDFRSNFEATPPPILIDNGLAVLENEKIERHIMKSIPGGHNLFVQDKEVATVIENVYSKVIFLFYFIDSLVIYSRHP